MPTRKVDNTEISWRMGTRKGFTRAIAKALREDGFLMG